jgi:hypothetical protein
MRYIISESKLNDAMIKLFNQYINVDEIKYYHPVEETEDGDEYEDLNRAIFYIGDIELDDSEIFRYYECDYFEPQAQIKTRCPLISLDYDIIDTFNDLFGDLWKEPFLKWVNYTFDLYAKEVE